MHTFHHQRGQSGQAVSTVAVISGILIIGVLGILAFEFSRVSVGRDQLLTATDAAALAGAATLASSDFTNTASAHTEAEQSALRILQSNDVIGTQLGDVATVQGSLDAAPSPHLGQTVVSIQFLDPTNNNQPVPKGDPRGKVIQVAASFGYRPAFFSLLNLGNQAVPIRTTSEGGVPSLDFVLVFDVSGSMDDETKVSLVKRSWNAATTTINYQLASGTGGTAEGMLKDHQAPQAAYPQALDWASFSGLSFDGDLRGEQSGHMPGNFSGGANPAGAGKFTDLVVNLDGNNHFANYSSGGYAFNSLGELVEASRGNLEPANFNAIKAACPTCLSGMTLQPGSQQKYLDLVRAAIEPLGLAQVAVSDFFDVMNTNARARFGFITFSDDVGVDANSVMAQQNKVAPSYPSAGTISPPIPYVGLPSDPNQTHYHESKAAVMQTVAWGATNISAGLNASLKELTDKTKARKDAKKAVVLFTDGVATAPGDKSAAQAAARQAAQDAQKAGIPIYCIGLAMDPTTAAEQKAMLDDTPGSQGIAAIAGNGSKFWQTTSASELRRLFGLVARELTQLVR